MKSKVISLTKVFLKNSFQPMGQNVDKKKKGLAILYVFAFLYLAAIMGFMSFGLIQTLYSIGQEQIFLNMFLVGVGAFFLIQSVFSCINVFYFSKNIEAVLPLPLKPYEIIMAKLNTILVTEYITELIFGLIPLTLYGIITGAGALYYVMALLAILLFPILPLLVVTLLIMIIMSFVKLTKHKDKFQMIMGTLSIVLVIIFQLFSVGSSEEITETQLIEKLMEANGMADLIGNYFFTLKPLVSAMTATSILSAGIEIAKVVLITIIGYLIVLSIGQKLYLRGAVGNSSNGGGVKNKKIESNKAYKTKSIGLSYIEKEFKLLLRNPVYFMQCILPAILMPVLFLIIIFSGANSEGSFDISSMMSSIDPFLIILIGIGIMQFLSMMIYISATAISRDGKNAIFTKYIPLSLHKQFIYKMAPNVIMNIITMLIVFVIISILMPIPVWIYIPIFIIGLLFAVIHSYFGLLIDLRKPKLEWDTEYAVVKQNMNLMWPMLFGILGIGVVVLYGVFCNLINLSIIPAIGILITILCLIIFLIDRYVKNNQCKIFNNVF